MTSPESFVALPDRELLAELKRLAERERHATADLVSSLAEVDARRLFLGEGCSSLFVYCTRVLHLSESAAYARIAAARAGRRFPLVLELLARGDVTLTTVCLLAPHLTEETHRDALAAARHKGKREVEQLVASLHPRPDVPSTVRKLPVSPSTPGRVDGGPSLTNAARPAVPQVDTTATTSTAVPSPVACAPAPRPSVVAPLAPERYRVQFTVDRRTHDKLRRAQDLLRHAVPTGDPAEIFDRALTLLVEHLEKTKLASAKRPREPRPLAEGSRHIPAAVRRAVWRRDDGRCAFEGAEGRCRETGFLEFHHVVPYASGGAATVENIQLRCRAHNQHEAQEWFGPMFVRERAPSIAVSPIERSSCQFQNSRATCFGTWQTNPCRSASPTSRTSSDDLSCRLPQAL